MSINQARSLVAVEGKKYKKDGGESPPESLQDARRVLAEEKLKQYIGRTVASSPPLSIAQKDRLSVLMRGTGQ